MKFDADDFDWAYGELLHLFTMAGRTWRMPHEIDPNSFYSAWSVLNAQPFEVRDACQKGLMLVWGGGHEYRSRLFSRKRYENLVAR